MISSVFKSMLCSTFASHRSPVLNFVSEPNAMPYQTFASHRSPVLNSVSEAINGLATVRAFGAQERLQQRHAMLVDTSSAMALAQMSMNR